MKGNVFVYRDRRKKNEWRWRAVANNGRKVANGGESLTKRAHAVKEARIAAKAWKFALVINGNLQPEC